MLLRFGLPAICLFNALAPNFAAAADLPAGLQARLEENVLSCSYQLFATKGYGRLESEPNFLKEVKARFDSDVSSSQVLSTGTAFSSAAALAFVYMEARAWNNVGPIGLGAAASSGLATSSIGAKAKSKAQSVADFDPNQLEKYASKTAHSLANVMALDPVRENALRSEIIRTSLNKIKSRDNSNLSLFTVLKEATYSGKPLLTADEQKNLDEIFNRSNDPATPKETSNEDRVKFLAACKEAVKIQLPKTSGHVKEAAEKVTLDAERFQKDLSAYIALHPEAKNLAMPVPRARPVGTDSGGAGDTSMKVE